MDNLSIKIPLRISLAGGGLDLPEYYLIHGARLLSVAIDIYIHVSVEKNITHQSSPLTDLFKSFHPDLNVSINSEVSPGAGLGGSGAVAAGLALANNFITNSSISPIDIGLKAFEWEHSILKMPVGFQDMMVCAFGGCVEMRANKRNEITVHERPDLIEGLSSFFNSNFILVESGIRRKASPLLYDLAKSYKKDNKNALPATVENIEESIIRDDIRMFGKIIKDHWDAKCKRLPEATNENIDFIIHKALTLGAFGAKNIGAGGGGFILICCAKENRETICNSLSSLGCEILKPSISFDGAKII
jgi:D-glycero-alpha-D-manno-heptose-7-phosphate kinase